MTNDAPVALITGASAGLGLALARALAARGWRLVLDARGEPALRAVQAELSPAATAVAGDVSDPRHRHELLDAVSGLGRLDLLVNNASEPGRARCRRWSGSIRRRWNASTG